MRRSAPAVLACLALAACAGVTIPQPPRPTPTPVVTPSPVCAPGQVYGCYAQPPGKGWVYVCPTYNVFTGQVTGTIETPGPESCVKPVILGPPPADAPVSSADCPVWPLEPGATITTPVRGPYGKKGFYVELRVLGSPSTCIKVHGTPVNPNSCHLEGWPTGQRCERFLIKTFGDGVHECPIWWARTPTHSQFPCVEDDPYGNSMSCDHFGSAASDLRDDPKTPEFEGVPAECGLYRDSRGKPASGFFAIVLGVGEIGASVPGSTKATNWLPYVEPE